MPKGITDANITTPRVLLFHFNSDFIKKAIKIDPNSIKYASKKLRQNVQIAKLVLKKDKKLANKYIFKKTLSEIK